MKEIYADFNNFTKSGVLDLRCPGSIESISSYGDTIVEGEEVYFSDGEIKVKGFMHRYKEEYWEGRSENWIFEDC